MRIKFFLLVTILVMAGCASDRHKERQHSFKQWIQENGKVKILSTTAIVNELVKRVGGEHVDAEVLIQGELDPHSYQLVKGDDEKLAFAQLIFYSGLGLEHGPSLYQYLLKNPKAVSLGDSIARIDPDKIILVEGQKDPHIWMDIKLWSSSIPFIVEMLSRQDPTHAEDFNRNGELLVSDLAKTDGQVKAFMQSIPEKRRYLVTSHDAFNYFVRAYLAEPDEIQSGNWKKRFAAPEGLAPESQLSVMDIQAIIDHLKLYSIHLIFPESNVSRDSIRKIIQAGNEQGVDVKIACCSLYGDAMGEPGTAGDTYQKMLLYNAKTLVEQMNTR